MGLGMMTSETGIPSRMSLSTYLLYALHLILALSLPVVLSLVVGCTKIEEEVVDYGPEVDADKIDLALAKAVDGASTEFTAVGQKLNYLITRRLENEETTQLLGSVNVEVMARDDAGPDYKFTLKISESERLNSNGEFEIKVSEQPLYVEKTAGNTPPLPPSPTASRLVSPRNAKSLEALTGAMVSATERRVTRVSYHKLREFTESTAPSKVVSERPGCGGLNPCEIKMRYIQFDLVQWYNDGGSQKVSFDFGFALETPYLPFGESGSFTRLNGLLVLDCRSTYVPIEGRTVYVRDCQNLEDFQK